MSEVLSNTGAKLWSETDYNELWLTVFDQLTGQGGKSNIRLIDEAIGKINDTLDGYKFEFSSVEDRLYISKGDLKLPVSLIDSKGHVASKVDGATITIDENGIVKGIPVDDALSEESTNPLQNKVIAGELKSIKSKMETDESAIKQNTSDITNNTKRIEANETAISTLNGTGEGSVKKTVSDGIAEVVAGAPEDFDTLKEMSDWISTHETSASAMNSQIQNNKTKLSEHTTDDNIHVTIDDRPKWNKVVDKLDKTGDVSNTTVSFNPSATRENLTTKEKLSTSFGKISKWFSDLKSVAFSGSYNDLSNKPTSLPANGGNSDTVNNHTVNADVPSGAKFTDTTYNDATTSSRGLMTAAMVTKLNGIADGANKTTVDTALSSTSTNPVQNKIVYSEINKRGNKISYSKETNTLSLLNGTTVLSSVEIKSGGGATITPKPTVNPQIKNDDGKVIITWQDPTDTVIEGSTFSTWAGTKLVMKESGYPTSPDDGTLLVDNTTRDKYKTTGFTKTGLTNYKKYYFALFPYSTDGVYNYDSGNRLLGEPTDGLKFVTFAGGTDDEIAKMIQAHYNDQINIADYWAVGDTRTVHLSAMAATGVNESHREQDVQFVIGDFEHDDLTTPINGHSKAAITLLQKDCLVDAYNAVNPIYGVNNKEVGYMDHSSQPDNWKECARRTWCNNVYFKALPTTWQSMVKTVNKKAFVGNYTSTIEIVQDKIFLAAVTEIFSSSSYANSGEGTQYQYYKNATANRYKMPKWTSDTVSSKYWGRSPYGGPNSGFCKVDYDGSENFTNSDSDLGLAPCVCI